jgi:hypothetical protein
MDRLRRRNWVRFSREPDRKGSGRTSRGTFRNSRTQSRMHRHAATGLEAQGTQAHRRRRSQAPAHDDQLAAALQGARYPTHSPYASEISRRHEYSVHASTADTKLKVHPAPPPRPNDTLCRPPSPRCRRPFLEFHLSAEVLRGFRIGPSDTIYAALLTGA